MLGFTWLRPQEDILIDQILLQPKHRQQLEFQGLGFLAFPYGGTPVLFLAGRLLHYQQLYIIPINIIPSMSNINAWTVLVNPPHQLLGEQNEEPQSFVEMITNLLAPYYKLKSLTTLLIFVSVIVYITLVVPYPPFLKIPTFALESLVLLPEHLKHFEFYRLFTAPFIYQDITSLVLGILLLWCLGSFTEEIMGWKMFTVFTGLSGLVGCSNSYTFPVFLFGCNFSIQIMKWSDPTNPILYRKVMLIVYIISIIIFMLLFVNYKREEQYNFYSSALYGFLLASALGKHQDGPNLTIFRKLLSTSSLIAVQLISFCLLIGVVFYGKTFI